MPWSLAIGRNHVLRLRRGAVELDEMALLEVIAPIFRSRLPGNGLVAEIEKRSPSSGRLIRSCGRFGPATLGCTSPRSSSRSTL